jgi:single-stranded-DNA-specific exonuclease
MESHLREWIVEAADDRAATYARTLGVTPLVAQILLARGMEDASAADGFLNASLARMPDPAQIADISRAATRLLDGIRAGEKITIYGDYDVDGVTSSAVLWLFCRDHLGVELDCYIPHRLTEGYGLNLGAIDALAEQGTKVLVTVDNGSSAVKELTRAQELGMDAIVVDHQQVSDPEPPTYAHLNPHRQSCGFPYKGLAAVGVTFMLLIELRRQMRTAAWYTGPAIRPDRYLDLVALGTVADVAPLTEVNRAIVRHGIAQMRRGPRLGMRALMEVSKTNPGAITARDLGFRLGPRINAAGRLADAADGFHLLVGDDRQIAQQLAEALNTQNLKRRAIEKRMTQQAKAQVEAQPDLAQLSALVLAGEDWHPGVVGIVASRMVEAFHRPAIMLARDGDQYRGSARSVAGVDIKAALDGCAEHLTRYGGHVGAAGLSLPADALSAFREALSAAVSQQLDRFGPQPLHADAEIDLRALSPADVAGLESLGPFGEANPSIKLVARGVRGRPRALRGGHLKIDIWGTAGPCEAIGWGMEPAIPMAQGPVDMIFTPRMETWRGRRRLVLDLKDLRATGAA